MRVVIDPFSVLMHYSNSIDAAKRQIYISTVGTRYITRLERPGRKSGITWSEVRAKLSINVVSGLIVASQRPTLARLSLRA